MANIKSQKKRIITNEKSRMRNRAVKSELKTATRRMKDAVAAGNGAEAYAAACAACRLMDKAASKGVIHKNQAANRKSGIMALANTVATDADRAAYEMCIRDSIWRESRSSVTWPSFTRMRRCAFCVIVAAERPRPR